MSSIDVTRTSSDLPPVDERLIAPESRYEVLDGEVTYVAPADDPHATHHVQVIAVVEAYVGDDFEVACDMLTRTSKLNDFAPDVSVFPRARIPETGGRQLEVMAFEVVSTETLAHAGRKAAKLIERGVRRVFAVDVERGRGLEWSAALESWSMLDGSAVIEDAAFAVPLPIAAMVSAIRSDDAVARALLAKGVPVLQDALREGRAAAREEGRRATLRRQLTHRFGVLAADVDARIAAATSDELDRYLDRVLTATALAAVFT